MLIRIGKKMIAMALVVATLAQGAVAQVSAETAFNDTQQPLAIEAVPFNEPGLETERSSEDGTLLAIYNTVRAQYPTLSEDGKKILLPDTGNEEYVISLYGSSNKAVIDMDCNLTQPLEDMQVYLYYRVVNKTTGEELHMDNPIVVEVNGLYEDSQSALNRPQIMPGIREWKGNEGSFVFSGDLVMADESLRASVEIAKEYIDGMLGADVTVKTGNPSAGDIYFTWNPALTVGKEGYALTIDDVLTVSATEYTGIVYAGATITQMLMAGMTIPKGLMRDYPQYEVRAAMLDIARFYMPMDYLREVTTYAAFFKVNEFHAHINDNNGEQNHAFRVESKKFPAINSGIPADEVYSQEEYRQYQKDMKKYGLDVITEIDTPAHARFAAAYDSKLMLDDTRIDIRKPEAMAFIKSLVDEFLDGEDPVVQSTKFHIGIDEYDYSYADEIRNYTNEISAYIANKGYEPRIWCSIAKTETSPVVVENTSVQHVYLYSAANLGTLLDGEFQIINNSSKYLYVVPVTVNGCNDFMPMERCYNEWEAGKFNPPTVSTPKILEPGHPLLRGSETTIWYDDKTGCSEFDYFDRFRDQVMLMAEKNWFGKNLEGSTYEDFTARIEMYSNITPLANPGRYIPSQGNVMADYDFTQTVDDLSGNGYHAKLNGLSVSEEGLQLNQSGYVTLPFQGIGYPYCVDFTISVTEAPENAILFTGRDGTLFLNYDGTGKMGFERKGYRFVFDYEIPQNVKLNIRLVCKNREEKTYLYVENVLVGEAQLYKTEVETYGSTSFVIPAEKIGSGISGNLYRLTVAKAVYDYNAEGAASADKSALKAALEGAIDAYAYANTTATAYERAVKMAETVYADPSADQTKVDWAVQQIRETESNLSLIHTVNHSRDICPHCGKTVNEIQWEPWTFGNGAYIKNDGHYYLTQDVTVSTQVRIGAGDTATEDQKVNVVLDLNGYSFNNKSARCFFISPYCTFSIMDSVGNGTICGGGKATLTGGTIYAHTSSNLHLYGGTITASGVTEKSSGVLHVNAATFVMHSGLIYGGKAICADSATTDGFGGNISITSGGRFEMYGGTIAGGVATRKGGNVYLYKNSVMEMYDGLIIGGTSKVDVGGNISVSSSVFRLYGGTIRDGFAVNGGNIGNESSSTHEINGGLITGGVAKRYGGNVMINTSAAKLNINGGQIDGDMRILAAVKLTGSPKIGLGGSNGYIFAPGGGNMDISELASDARIYISRTASGVFTTGYDAAKHSECFLGAVRTEISENSSGELQVTIGTRGYCPHCGKLVDWKAWTPTSSQTITENVHYYLTADKQDISGQIKIGAHMAADNEVVIDFNGKKFAGSSRLFYVNSFLNLMDTTGYATVTGNNATATGAIATGRSNAMLSVYSGYYTVSSSTAGSLFAMSGLTRIYGGILDGSKIAKEADSGTLKVGWGALRIYAGHIIGGTTNQGGAVYFHGDNDKSFDLYGGVIEGGSSYKLGGNVYIGNEGIFQMRGGLIQDGTGDLNNINSGYNSDNVYVDTERKAFISGGYILGSDSDYKGNAITTWTKCIVKLNGDPTILNASGAGNLYVGSTAQLIVQEGFRGRVFANIQAMHLQAPYYGTELKNNDCAEGKFPGKLFVENVTGNPRVFATDAHKLQIAGAMLTDASGSETWCVDAQMAAKLAKGDSYIKLYADNSVLTNDAMVDLNGKQLTVSGDAAVTAFDSANKDFATYGKLTLIKDARLNNSVYTMQNGDSYCTLREADGSYSFHFLKMAIDSVVLRPGADGIYYSGSWQSDETLKSKVKTFGIAVSAVDSPDGYFREDPDTLWTEGGTSVMIADILKDGEPNNDQRGKQKIYAASYLILDDGSEMGFPIVTGTEVAYSLYDVMKLLDERAYAQNAEALEAYYAKWADIMDSWEFTNIGKS